MNARPYFHFLLLQLNLFLHIFVLTWGCYLSFAFFPCFSVQLVNHLASGPGRVPLFLLPSLPLSSPPSLPAQSCLSLSRSTIGYSAFYQTNQVP